MDRLQSRFGDREQIERFRFELKTRRRRKGETVQALHQDVCRLLALSYPGETGSLSKIVARDAFLDSLGDPEMRIRILEKGAASIEEAFSIAARYESYLAGSADLVSSDDTSRRRVRALNPQPDGNTADGKWRKQMEQSVSDLKDGVARLLQQQQQPPSVSPTVVQASPASSATSPAKSERRPPPSDRRPPPNRSNGACFACGATGHYARICPTKSTSEPRVPMRGIQSDGRGSEVYLTAQLYQGSKTVNVDATLDTGSFYSVLPAKYVGAASLRHTDIRLVAANGSDISVIGRARIRFTVEGVKLCADVLVSNAVDEWLLGYDFLCENRCVWNFADAIITVSGRELRLKRRCNVNYVRRVIASDNVVVPGNSAVHVPVKLAYTDIMHVRPSNWLIEPRVVGEGLLMPRSLFDDSEDAVVRLVNPTNCDFAVKRNYIFGNAEPLEFHCRICGDVCTCVPDAPKDAAGKIRALNVDPAVSNALTSSAAGKATMRSDTVAGIDVMTDDEIVLPMLKTLPDCVTDSQRVEIETLLRQHIDVFSRHEYDVGLTNVAEYKLELKDPRSSPVCEPLRQHPYAYLS